MLSNRDNYAIGPIIIKITIATQHCMVQASMYIRRG